MGEILMPQEICSAITICSYEGYDWHKREIYNDTVNKIIDTLESGYYFAKVEGYTEANDRISKWQIVKYDKENHYHWWIIGSECPIDNCDILEIGNKIELPN